MDIWGHCATCERWFYCEAGVDRLCPVCAAPAMTVQDRAHDARPVSTT